MSLGARVMRWAVGWVMGASRGPLVRPWALAVPVLVVMICLPLLRPLRSPDPRDISDDETLRLATMVALVETGSPAIVPPEGRPTGTTGAGLVMPAADGRFYSAQPPMLAALMAAGYLPMRYGGLVLAENPTLVPYLLTVMFATLPVAGVAGMVYRLGRVMALRRLYRTLLALLAVMGSGLLAYGTYINPIAPAAVLLMLAVACVMHMVANAAPQRDGGWLLLAGLSAGTAACIQPVLALPAVCIGILIFAIRWSRGWRIAGLALFLTGFAPPLAADAMLTADAPLQLSRLMTNTEPTARVLTVDDEEFGETRSLAVAAGRILIQLGYVLIGPFGVLSHVPLVGVGVVAGIMVLRRNWPGATKSLAGLTIGALVWCVASEAIAGPWKHERPFGPAGSAAVLPLLVLIMGIVLHSRWRPGWVAVIAILALLSCGVSLLGAASPMLRGGYETYSVYEAMMRLWGD